MHEVKGEVEAYDEQPEVQLAERFVVHTSAHLRKPVVKRTEKCKENGADDDVMKVRDHEVRAAELPIERDARQHDSGEARDQELEQESDAKQHWRLELQAAAPHCPNPIENLYSCWNSDHHCGKCKKAVGIRIHADREHVMGPHAKAHKANAHCGGDHYGIAEDGLPGEDRNDFGNEGERRDNQHVHFGMAENPEKVHPKNCRAPGLRVKEMSAQKTI